MKKQFISLREKITSKPIMVFNLLGVDQNVGLSAIAELVAIGKKTFGQSWNAVSRKIIILADQQSIVDFVWNNCLTICPTIDVVEDNLLALGDVFNTPSRGRYLSL